MMDGVFDIVASELGVDFSLNNDTSREYRGLIKSEKVLVDAYGSEVIANETSLTTGFSCSLDLGDEIEIVGGQRFRVKNKAEDYRMRTIEYGLEKIKN